jgi:four helix bundle protein
MSLHTYNEHASSDEDWFLEEPSGNYQNLELRTLQFAINVRDMVKLVELTIWNKEYIKQLVRASGSVGANYREANDSLGENDFLMKIRIARREAKEASYWLQLLDLTNSIQLESNRNKLLQESEELRLILSAIINKRIKK